MIGQASNCEASVVAVETGSITTAAQRLNLPDPR